MELLTPPTHPKNHPSNLPPAPGWPIHPAMVTVGFALPGYRVVRLHGTVRGLIVRAPRYLGPDGPEMATLREKARADAIVQMLQHAAQMGANGIIGLRYTAAQARSSSGAQNLAEVLAYGTAVWAEPTTASQTVSPGVA